MITIRVNGQLRSCPAGLELRDMLIHLGYQPEVVVVELNGGILSRAHWPGRVVVESDVLEVVTIVGGGT
ncbi:MAG: sulfur carrier protein ThiS [Cyanobacteriota bacterium]|jgi:sulfur carrier protein